MRNDGGGSRDVWAVFVIVHFLGGAVCCIWFDDDEQGTPLNHVFFL